MVVAACADGSDRPDEAAGPSQETTTPAPDGAAIDASDDGATATPGDSDEAGAAASDATEAAPEPLPLDITYELGGDVPDGIVDVLHTSLASAVDGVDELFGLYASDFTVVVSTDPDEVASRYIELLDVVENEQDDVHERFRDSAALESNGAGIFGKYDERWHQPDPRFDDEPTSQSFHFAHEYVHVVQWSVAPPDARVVDDVWTIGPYWLLEGVANYVAATVLAQQGRIDYGRYRGHEVEEAESARGSLGDMVTWADFEAEGYLPAYASGFLAAELLAARTDPGTVLGFWTVLADHSSWEETFAATFGLSVDEFYEVFEQHRAGGFPKP